MTSVNIVQDHNEVDFDKLHVQDPLAAYPWLVQLRHSFLACHEPQYQCNLMQDLPVDDCSVLHRFSTYVQDYLFFKETNEEILRLIIDAFDDYTRDGHIRAFDWDTFVNATAHNQIRLGLRQCYFNMDP